MQYMQGLHTAQMAGGASNSCASNRVTAESYSYVDGFHVGKALALIRAFISQHRSVHEQQGPLAL